MKVSVIICTYSLTRFNNLIDAVNSILKQTYKSYEIIVSVDNNKKLFSQLKENLPSNIIFVLNEGVRGLSATRNTGIKYASGDIIAFMDDDAIADTKWLENLITDYSDTSIAAVGGRLSPLWNTQRPWWFPEEIDWVIGCTYKGHPEHKTEVRNLIGCNMSFRKNVIQSIGDFGVILGRVNEVPVGGEETEYCIRINMFLPNQKIIYDPQAIIFHKVTQHRENIKYILMRAYGEGTSIKAIKRKLKIRTLSTENSYLFYLLFKSLPTYLKKALSFDRSLVNASVAFILIATILTTGIGYIIG
jgi:glycosyltransferase involved in cell wall biosynthesis